MSQKGGVGKSTLTNTIVLDWCFREVLRTKKMPKILLIDADAQASVSSLRKRDVDFCKLDLEGKEFQQMDAGTQIAIKEMRSQFHALYEKVGWTYYPIFTINVHDDGSTLHRAIEIIDNNEYEYVFIDMPGTLYQSGTADLLLYLNYIIIPVLISNYDIQSSLDFCKLISDENFHKASAIKEIRWIFNKYEVIKNAKYDEIEREMILETKIPFLKTRIRNSTFYTTKNYNTLIPSTFRVNLNTDELVATPKITNINDVTDELRKLVSEK